MTRTRIALPVAALAVAGAVPAVLSPAAACTAGSLNCTTASITVGTGSLSVNVSTAGSEVALTGGGLLAGSTVTGNLGTTQVNDTRGNSTGWTGSVTVTDFVNANGDRIPATSASVTGNPVSGASLPVVCGLGVLAVQPVVTLTAGTGAAAGTASGTLATCAVAGGLLGVGTNTASWGQSLSVNVPATAAPGTYRASVTQSVL